MNGNRERREYDSILHELCANGWRNANLPADNKDVRRKVQEAFDAKNELIQRLRGVVLRAQLSHARGCAVSALCPCSCGRDDAVVAAEKITC